MYGPVTGKLPIRIGCFKWFFLTLVSIILFFSRIRNFGLKDQRFIKFILAMPNTRKWPVTATSSFVCTKPTDSD